MSQKSVQNYENGFKMGMKMEDTVKNINTDQSITSLYIDLFYDKFIGDDNGNGDHHYNNKLTSGITMDNLNDGSFGYYESKEAIEYYNQKFTKNFLLPTYLYKFPLFKPKVYFKNLNGSLIIFVIISLNINILEKYYRSKEDIPCFKFLDTLFRYHLAYVDNSRFLNIGKGNNITTKAKENINYIITTSMKPVDYTFNNQTNNPKELNVQLYKYQKCSVNWMVNVENNIKKIRYNYNDEIDLGNMYYDNCYQKLGLNSDKNCFTLYGGGIIDEVGLGKTLQIISLVLKERSKRTSYIVDGYPKFISNATLVICPNHLCGQWIRECQNRVSKDYKLKLISIRTKVEFEKLTYLDLLEADIILISFNFLNNSVYKKLWVSSLWSNFSYNQKQWDITENMKVENLFKKMGKNLVNKPLDFIYQKNPLFQLIHWHRIVVDEFHEIYKSKVLWAVHNSLKFLKSDFRWIVTATPFINSKSLDYSIFFLNNYNINEYNHKIQIYNINSIIDKLSYHTFRRNTKKSVENEYTLPLVKEEINWIKFTHTESLMYNAHITNKFNDKFGIYLRKLCCHPQLAEETKSILANCKTLDDVEKNIIKFYNIEVDKAQEKVHKLIKSIEKIKYKIEFNEIRLLKKEAIKLKLIEDDTGEEEFDIDFISMIGDDNIINFSDNDCYDIINNSPTSNDIISDDQVSEKTLYEIFNINDEIYNTLYNMPTTTNILTGSKLLDNLNTYKEELEERLNNANEVLKGKQSTANFFNNVLEKIKKIMKNADSLKNSNDSDDDSDNESDDDSEDDSDDDSDDSSNDDSEEESDEESNEEENIETCGICLSDIPEDEIGVTICGHLFCYECLTDWIKVKNKCPYCNKSLSKEDIYSIAYTKKKTEVTKEIKDKMELINSVGSKLATLINYLKECNKHTIIFSQWDDLLIRIGRILKMNGIPNVFCKGHCYQRDKAIRDFNSDDKIKVIMLSSDSSASGTNLTKASQIVFIEPIYGSYQFRREQERQAIGRAHRLGQQNEIKVVRFLIKNTIEEDIHNMNIEENKKHPQVFSESVDKLIK